MKRVNSIDFTRGLVMVIMALDHVRDFMHVDSLTQSPTDLKTTTAALFFTRLVTHLCAPTFVFLSGVSAFISFRKNNNVAESRAFLFKRGLWLVLLEFTVINFSLWFDVQFRGVIMEVICAIGFGFIVLSLLLKLPPRVIGIVGLIIIFGHNLLQSVSFATQPAMNVVFSVLFSRNLFAITKNLNFIVGYPLVPWLGILLAGYGFGQVFEMSAEKRKRILLLTSIAALMLFVVIRFTNVYGDPAKWEVQKNSLFTFLSFINITKYPPSLLFDFFTLGITMMVLYLSEGIKNRFTDFFSVYGKVPLFYFIVHLYLIHIIMFVMLFMQGYSAKDFVFANFGNGRPAATSGLSLPGIYLVWISVVLFLYPFCKWYGNYKFSHKENALLRYL